MTNGILSALFGIGLISGCGAPTKSAADVASQFGGASATIDKAIQTLCAQLPTRKAAGWTKPLTLTAAECGSAGKTVVNYRDLGPSLQFENLTNEKLKDSGKDVLHVRTRAQVWLNRNILSLALKLADSIKQKSTGGKNIFDQDSPDTTSDPFAKVLKTSIKELTPVKLSDDRKTFEGSINIKGDGIATINNDFNILGEIFSDSISIDISSSKESDFKSSLIKDATALALVVPHAKDVYVDVTFELNVYSVGLDSIIADKIQSALGSSLKKGMDALLKTDVN